MMGSDKAKPERAITHLILAVFRLNGRLVSTGDRLVGAVGLTSARWQVLGALVLLDGKATALDVARVMGLARQSVQRVATAMMAEGLIEPAANPRHLRAPLLTLSPKGRLVYAAAARRQSPWARTLAKGVAVAELENAAALIETLASRLEQQSAAGSAQRRRPVPMARPDSTSTRVKKERS